MLRKVTIPAREKKRSQPGAYWSEQHHDEVFNPGWTLWTEAMPSDDRTEIEPVWPEISAQLPPGHFIIDTHTQKNPVFISVFGCFEAIFVSIFQKTDHLKENVVAQ